MIPRLFDKIIKKKHKTVTEELKGYISLIKTNIEPEIVKSNTEHILNGECA